MQSFVKPHTSTVHVLHLADPRPLREAKRTVAQIQIYPRPSHSGQPVTHGRAGGPTEDAQPWNEDSAQKRVGASAAPNAATAKDLPKLPNQVTPSPTVVTGP